MQTIISLEAAADADAASATALAAAQAHLGVLADEMERCATTSNAGGPFRWLRHAPAKRETLTSAPAFAVLRRLMLGLYMGFGDQAFPSTAVADFVDANTLSVADWVRCGCLQVLLFCSPPLHGA